nr:hypothetical protein [Ruegeria profundi]
MNGFGDILDLSHPQIFDGEIELGMDLFENASRHVNAIRDSQAFNACGDIYTIPVNVILIDDNVANIETDPVSHLRILRQVRISDAYIVLHVQRTPNGLNCTCKLKKQAVAHQFDDAPMSRSDNWFKKLLAMGFDPCKRAGFVISNKTAIANHIGGKYRC